MVLKPGFLSKEYFDGKRIKYAPPFRIFIFMSFVLFLLLQIYTKKGLTTVLDSDFKDGKVGLDSASVLTADSILNSVIIELDSSEIAASDSFLNKYNVDVHPTDSAGLNLKLGMETFRDTRDLRQGLNKYTVVLENKLENEKDPEKRQN